MKILFYLLMLVIFSHSLYGAEPSEENSQNYYQALAENLGADDYGMKMYVMALLKKGPNRDQFAEDAAALQKAHMANIGQIAQAGSLVLACAFAENESGIQGIYIFDVTIVAEAKALAATDPAIKAGRLVMELIPWNGSAALIQVNEIGATLATKNS